LTGVTREPIAELRTHSTHTAMNSNSERAKRRVNG
jgi:hypothetical protein